MVNSNLGRFQKPNCEVHNAVVSLFRVVGNTVVASLPMQL